MRKSCITYIYTHARARTHIQINKYTHIHIYTSIPLPATTPVRTYRRGLRHRVVPRQIPCSFARNDSYVVSGEMAQSASGSSTACGRGGDRSNERRTLHARIYNVLFIGNLIFNMYIAAYNQFQYGIMCGASQFAITS